MPGPPPRRPRHGPTREGGRRAVPHAPSRARPRYGGPTPRALRKTETPHSPWPRSRARRAPRPPGAGPCASEVTAHVFTTIASASSRHTMRMPSRESSRPIASSSALFTRQPRLTSETLARPITSCAWASQRLHGRGDGRRSPRPARQPWRRRRARLGQPRWSGSPRGPRRRGRRARSR